MGSINIYQAAVRIAAILSILAMAIVDDYNSFQNNDVFYAGVMAAIVIGPHALDRLAGDDTRSSSTREAAKIGAFFAPFIGVSVGIFRMMSGYV